MAFVNDQPFYVEGYDLYMVFCMRVVRGDRKVYSSACSRSTLRT
jgi:hypothetical protein